MKTLLSYSLAVMLIGVFLLCSPSDGESASVIYSNNGYRVMIDPAGYRIYSVGGKYLVGVPTAWNTKGAPTKYAYVLTAAQAQAFFGVQ
jgi:hypothetical protein